MAAYAAANSLEATINCFLYRDWVSLDPLSEEIIKLVEKKLKPLRMTVDELDRTRKSKSRKKINDLDGRIKEALWRLEDLLESHITDQILSQLENHQYLLRRRRKARYRRQLRKLSRRSLQKERDALLFSIDLQGLQHDVDSFLLEMESLEKDYVEELKNLPEEEEGERICFGGMKKSKMVGLSDQFDSVKDFLMENHDRNRRYCLFGMAGIGKTTLAEKIFEDAEIRSRFEHRVWVNVGRKSRTKEYYARVILSQLDPTDGKEDERDVSKYVRERLKGKKCLIVLDDAWEREELDLVKRLLPKKKGIVQILLTARNQSFLDEPNKKVVRFMNEDESTSLLCKKVFGEEGSLPSHLEKVDKKIAKICEGLPLLIIAVADRLSKGDMTEEYWNEVAEKKNSVLVDALDEISKVLFPSYDYLPQYLKMFFLYLGVFPPDCDIPPSKLTNQLASEGFIDPNSHIENLGSTVLGLLDILCLWHFLVLYNKKSKEWRPNDTHKIVKTCRLHCSWRHLCQVEARKNKFYQVLNRCVDASEEVIKDQRCLSLHNNVLLAIKDAHDSMKRECASTTRSLLCLGPYHQYPVPIDLGFKLLRKLDALKLRFYTFPTEILQLVHLKYLSLTCNGDIPPTISKLTQLQIFILHPHTNIKIRGAPSYIPIQIWGMEKLQHIEILGRILRAPNHVASLDSLIKLLGVNASITTLLKVCDKFQGIRKLGIQIELMPYDDDNNLLNCFRFISELPQLETLKCSIVNPQINHQFLVLKSLNSLKFSYSLRKLHLSGMSFPWKFMNALGSLPYLEVLKLRCFAFRGPKWNVKEKSFQSLQFLLIEDSDLEQWILRPRCFRVLSHLSMKHCYKLQKLHWPSDSLLDEIKIELVDCNPLAVTSAKQIPQSAGRTLNLNLIVTSSYGGQNESLKLERQRSWSWVCSEFMVDIYRCEDDANLINVVCDFLMFDLVMLLS